MYENILLPFDGSERVAEALHHAAEISHWADATIRVLFVADTTRDSVTVVENQVVMHLFRKARTSPRKRRRHSAHSVWTTIPMSSKGIQRQRSSSTPNDTTTI